MEHKFKCRVFIFAMILAVVYTHMVSAAPEKEDRPFYKGEGTSISDATFSNAAMASEPELPVSKRKLSRRESGGDLWSEWVGSKDFPGKGTRKEPFQISTISQLMGLSEMVSGGTSFEGKHIELTEDIDLGNLTIGNGNWNPIGWYRGEVVHSFKGNFDGGGNTISGLTIVNTSQDLSNIGLFGVVEGGTIKNLRVEAEYVYGAGNVGILAGQVLGDTVIYNVSVTGYLRSNHDVGGIAGLIKGGAGKKAVVENCVADGIVIDSGGNTGFVGGIVGNAENACLVDNSVRTYDGDSNRIQGKGFVGGIAGRMKRSDIYNSYVSGTIGGNRAKAAGGIVGKYESGNLVVARFDGDIARTNNGIASKEGTFVGTRENHHNFTYGTGSNSNISYLFTTSGSKAKSAFGSNIDGDNKFSTAAHIGYWVGNKYMLVAGRNEYSSKETYFYEELEAGIKYIITEKLGKEFTASGYSEGLNFELDHFAPGYQGEPVRGYLVSVPRIDAANANGTYDADVAALTALPTSNNSYYRQIDKDHASAVAYGTVVTVTTAPKNAGNARYQMTYDETESGKVKPPTYTDGSGAQIPMNYQSDGIYTFVISDHDTELNAQYQKVTTEITNMPAEITIYVTHIREGNRKDPVLSTEVRNTEGVLIARYIDETMDADVEVQPILVRAKHNQDGTTADRAVKWVVDDMDLITNLSEAGYTRKDARIMPNLASAFIRNTQNREVQAQIKAGYGNPIGDTVYTRYAVLSSISNPAASLDNQSMFGNTRLRILYQILDRTTVRVEGLSLNKHYITATITRKLTGDRLNPVESFLCSEPTMLTAIPYPQLPYYKQVAWKDRHGSRIISLTPGEDTGDCTVAVRYDAGGKEHPAWIQDIITADRTKRLTDKYQKISGSGTFTEKITAVSEDQTNGHIVSECDVTVNFVTVDETEIYPERVEPDRDTITFDLKLTKYGRRSRPWFQWAGQEAQTLGVTVYPELPDNDVYERYNRRLIWNTDDETLRVTDGVVTPNLESDWLKAVISKYPYKGTKEIALSAIPVGQGKPANCKAVVNVTVIDHTYLSGTGSGGGTGSLIPSRQKAEDVSKAALDGTWVRLADDCWSFVFDGRTYAGEWAYIYNPYAAGNQMSTGWFRFAEDGHMVTGRYTDPKGRIFYLNPLSDNTQGRMVTGWNWLDINGDGAVKCYYFDLKTGELLKNTKINEYEVDNDGAWVVDKIVQSRHLQR